MAFTLIGAALGSAIPGGSFAIGGAVINLGAMLGSYLDALALTQILGGANPEPPKLGDVSLGSTSEGAPIYRVFGRSRVPALQVWQSPLKMVEDPTSGGTKGGPSGEFIQQKWYGSVALLVARHQISKIPKIWTDGKIFYDESPTILFTSTKIAALQEKFTYFTGIGGGTATTEYQLRLTNTDGSVDLSKFKAGGEIVVSGFASPATADNSSNSPTGAWRVVSSSRSGSDPLVTDVLLEHPNFGSGYVFITKAQGDSVTLNQDFPLFKSSLVKDIRFYLGTDDQVQDKLLDKWIKDPATGSVLNIPYRQRALIVLEDILLTTFGNRFPNFEVEVVESENPTRAEVIGRLMRDAGYGDAEFNVSKVSGTVRGFSVRGPQPTNSVLQPLAVAYDIMTRRNGDILEFYDRSEAPTYEIDSNDLAAFETGSEPEDVPFRCQDDEELFIPRRLEVRYIEEDNDFQPGMRAAPNPTAAYEHVETLNLDLVLTNDEAMAVASKLLDAKMSARTKVTISLPHYYMDKITEGMVVTIRGEMGDDWALMVNSMTIGANFLIELECRVEDPRIFTQLVSFDQEVGNPPSGGGDAEEFSEHVASVQANPIGTAVVETANLIDGHSTELGVYIAPYNQEPRYPWRGALLYESVDGSEFFFKQPLRGEAIVGKVVTPGATLVSPANWDTVNTIRVQLYGRATRVRINPELASRSDDAVMEGANRIAILTAAGWEIIGFANATLVTTDPFPTYDLTRLIRGLRNTESRIGSMLAGDTFVFLSGPGVTFIPMNQAAVGRNRYWKVLSQGDELASAKTITLHMNGESIKPFSVDDVIGLRDGSNNLTGRFHRRSRAILRAMDTRKPLFEDFEQYDVELLAAAGSTVLRTKTIERPVGGWTAGRPEFSYTAAEQTTDGLTPGPNNTKVRIYQVSSRVGRGRMTEKVI